jgi:hypothetical protein
MSSFLAFGMLLVAATLASWPAAAQVRAGEEVGRLSAQAVQEVTIDIRPYGKDNVIGPKWQKVIIPVAILTTGGFDATQVDPTTVRFGPNGAAQTSERQPRKRDVDKDGDRDLLLFFKSGELGVKCGDTSASLTGKTKSGQAIHGTDAIKTVGCKPGGGGKKLVLWNKLGSQAEIENSEVGPDGFIYGSGLSFVPGKFGNGFTSGTNISGPNFGPWLTINPDYTKAGTIEFWWKPARNYNEGNSSPDETFSSGAWQPTPWAPLTLMYRWRENPAGLGGFEFSVADKPGTSYNFIYQTGKVAPFSAGEWVHVAYVWDTEGGLNNNPNVYYGIYVNGQSYSLTDILTPGAPINAPMLSGNGWYFSLGYYTADWNNQFNGVLDNVKVWNYAKTDFSDRFTE